ncbi:hypothetical protein LJB89_02625 [Tyzzerella sp. OttesenSCG-928-J15]|nr:hypothetical protein [Tyzzerella sp. OttesenSCG-928-J15]
MRDLSKRKKRKIGLSFIMTLFIFLIMLASSVVIGLVAGMLTRLGIIDSLGAQRNPLFLILSPSYPVYA